jgi:hypothetical protein
VKRQLGALSMATLVLVGTACGSDSKTSVPALSSQAAASATTNAVLLAPEAKNEAPADTAAAVEGEASAPNTAAPAAPAPIGGVVAPPVGNQIREASLAIDVPTENFDQTVSEVASIATIVGGFVASSDATITDRTNKDREAASASLVIRVPSQSFEEVRTKLSRLGTITSINFSGQDVSAQLVDLGARTKTLEAKEDAYNALLTQAKAIPDIVNITNEITAVRTEIEQLKAQEASLKDRVSYSTFTVRVDEVVAKDKPVEVVAKKKPVPVDNRGEFEKVWDDSTDALLAIVTGIGIVLVAVAPFAIALAPVALLGWWLSRRAANRRRRDFADGLAREAIAPQPLAAPVRTAEAEVVSDEQPTPVG